MGGLGGPPLSLSPPFLSKTTFSQSASPSSTTFCSVSVGPAPHTCTLLAAPVLLLYPLSSTPPRPLMGNFFPPSFPLRYRRGRGGGLFVLLGRWRIFRALNANLQLPLPFSRFSSLPWSLSLSLSLEFAAKMRRRPPSAPEGKMRTPEKKESRIGKSAGKSCFSGARILIYLPLLF